MFEKQNSVMREVNYNMFIALTHSLSYLKKKGKVLPEVLEASIFVFI